MTPRLRATALLVLTAVAATAVAAVVATHRQSVILVEFTGDGPAPFFDGFYPAERAPDGTTYAWTRPNFSITLPGLDRSHGWRATLRLRAARPDEASPDMVVAVDGIVVERGSLPPDYTNLQVELPPRTGSADSQLSVAVSPPYVPTGDPRELGALVDSIRIEPSTPSQWSMPTSRVVSALLPVVVLAACLGLIGAAGSVGVVTVALTATAAAAVVTHGMGPYTDWPTWGLAATSLLTGWLVWFAVRRQPAASTVMAITAGFTFVKLLTVFHPAMPIGDAVFHAHRLQTVMAGNYLFTSITPGNYAFPYAPGLYVAALPFVQWAESVGDKVALLRILTICAESAAAGLMFLLVLRWRGTVATALAAVVLAHILPLGFNVLAVGNLTNHFAQSLALVALVMAAGTVLTRGQTLALGAMLCAAFLSHTSTFAVLTAQLACASLLLLLARRDPARTAAGRSIAVVTAVSVMVAIVGYYGHFGEVYATAFGRAAEETGGASSLAGGRTPWERLVDVPRLLELYYTWPGVFLAGLGAWRLTRDCRTAGGDQAVVAWVLASCVSVIAALVVFGIVTPVDLRHYLAAIPLVAILAADGLAQLWRKLGAGRWAAAALALWLAAAGVMRWFNVLG